MMSKYFVGGLVAASLFLSGCASTPGSITGGDNANKEARVGARDSAVVKVTKGATDLLEHDTARLQQIIGREIDAYKLKNVGKTTNEVKYRVEVEMLTYEKGSAFARAVLAGLGQMKLNAKVTVYDEATNTQVASYVADKVFAWGGIYGASTSIQDVEPAFAEAIAQGVTGVEKKN